MDISDDYEEEEEEEEEEDSDEEIRPEDIMMYMRCIRFNGYTMADLIAAEEAAARTADIIPGAGVVGASDGSELNGSMAEALETVEAPSDGDLDCSICMQDDDGTATWKETPCGHRFHGRCLERWLQAKGSCPMCRSQVVTMPTAAATSTNSLEFERSVMLRVFGQLVPRFHGGGVVA